MNNPYVKVYNENGTVKNPIKEVYLSKFDNRKARRSFKNEIRFKGNTRHVNLTVLKESKFVRFVQTIFTKTGIKRINHYLPA